jgi:hypothetical protein
VRNPFFNPQELDNAVFATDTLGFSPEWFARIGGELYLAGLNSTSIPLPDVATDVVASEKAIEQLKSCARAMMVDNGAGKEIEVLRQGLVSLFSYVQLSIANHRSASALSHRAVDPSCRVYLTTSLEDSEQEAEERAEYS